jgi:steroid delta-isomerase-like uncharacterized protein
MEASTKQPVRSPEQLAREAFEALDRHDLSRAEEIWGPDSVDHFLPVGEFRGTEAIAGYFRGLFAAMPDFSIKPERILSDGPHAVVQWRASGTFDGEPFMGIEPTGRSVELRGVDVIEWRDDGRIGLNTIYYDGAEFARQVGMLPPRDSGADKAITAAFNAATKLRAQIRERLGSG